MRGNARKSRELAQFGELCRLSSLGKSGGWRREVEEVGVEARALNWRNGRGVTKGITDCTTAVWVGMKRVGLREGVRTVCPHPGGSAHDRRFQFRFWRKDCDYSMNVPDRWSAPPEEKAVSSRQKAESRKQKAVRIGPTLPASLTFRSPPEEKADGSWQQAVRVRRKLTASPTFRPPSGREGSKQKAESGRWQLRPAHSSHCQVFG